PFTLAQSRFSAGIHPLEYTKSLYFQESSLAVPIREEARASTLRLTLGYETRPYYGVSLFAEYEGVRQLGSDSYRMPTVPGQNVPDVAVILDPESDELNQGGVKLHLPVWDSTFKVGRQEILLNNGRFVSISTWRQNHQTYDAASLTSKPFKNFTFFYAFLGEMQRVVGPDATDGRVPMRSHLLHANYSLADRGQATAYAYLLDNRDSRLPATLVPFFNSTKSFGLRLEGPWKLSDDWSLLYTAEFANQTDYARNPNQVNVNYAQAELGAAFRQTGLKFGYTLVQGDSATDKLQTPLAHPHNGWVEKFLITPSLGTTDHGLQLLSASLSSPIRPVDGLVFIAIYYDYWADHGKLITDGNSTWPWTTA
ncbi:MAG: hypothetical protein O2960_29325, partial [Verrucomicrobia bacterium]|nr:hypothetical protein [Verrucomicrobiota bacterium]